MDKSILIVQLIMASSSTVTSCSKLYYLQDEYKNE